MGEDKFKAMIDVAIDELVFEGTIDRILKKYETVPSQFLRVTLPYKMN